jgi:peptide deformylase
MPVRALVRFPDPRLARTAAVVGAFGDDLAALIEDIRDTLVSEAAIGLTAPHLGVSQRVFMTRMAPEATPRAYVNPIVLEASAEMASHDEGSVSMPGIRERVTRPARIRLRYADPGGALHEEIAEGFEAAVLQHEIDQLDGLFWIHRLSRLKRDRLLKRFGKLPVAGDA